MCAEWEPSQMGTAHFGAIAAVGALTGSWLWSEDWLAILSATPPKHPIPHHQQLQTIHLIALIENGDRFVLPGENDFGEQGGRMQVGARLSRSRSHHHQHSA